MKKLFSSIGLLIFIILIQPSCNNLTDDPDFSDSLLTVVSINPQPFCSVPTSDVNGTYWDDNATFTIANNPKDRDPLPSFYRDVVISRYTISYEYDNPNGPEASSFTNYHSQKIPAGQSAEYTAVVVRATDKIAGYFVSGMDVKAAITFYGQDVSGEEVQTTGFFTINFRDICAEEEQTQ